MADHFYGLNNTGLRDNGDADVTVGTSTGATDVEIRVADAAGWNKGTLSRMIHALEEYIEAHAEFPII
tara:strand:+ start:2188 stop:2391 length:204 start_codon:yes stop_codon:yes gene_type:complete